MDSLRIPSFAKINLGLQVIRKDPDDYHQIRTIFQMIDLQDELVIRPGPRELRLKTDGFPVPPGKDNLVLQAARALLRAGRVRRGADIHLTKRIPVAAGLGGGSSNAAAALRGLNQVWSLGIGMGKLTEISRDLGADVPFFLFGGAALGTGRGDRIRPLRGALRQPILVVCPPVKLSTRTVYEQGDFGLTPQKPRITMKSFSLALSGRVSLADLLVNDLEMPAFRLRPVARAIKLRLRDLGAVAVSMSGSGPSVFGVFPRREAAEKAAEFMRDEGNFCSVSFPMDRDEFRQSTRVIGRQTGGLG